MSDVWQDSNKLSGNKYETVPFLFFKKRKRATQTVL